MLDWTSRMPGAQTKNIMSAPGPKLKMYKRLYTPPFYGYQIIVFMTKDFWLRADFVIYNEHIL